MTTTLGCGDATMNVGIMVIEVRDGLVENVEDDREVIDDEPILI